MSCQSDSQRGERRPLAATDVGAHRLFRRVSQKLRAAAAPERVCQRRAQTNVIEMCGSSQKVLGERRDINRREAHAADHNPGDDALARGWKPFDGGRGRRRVTQPDPQPGADAEGQGHSGGRMNQAEATRPRPSMMPPAVATSRGPNLSCIARRRPSSRQNKPWPRTSAARRPSLSNANRSLPAP